MGAEGTFFVSERAPRAATAPHEDTEFDRGWPYLPQLAESEANVSAGATAERGWPWAGDHNAIAPAQ